MSDDIKTNHKLILQLHAGEGEADLGNTEEQQEAPPPEPQGDNPPAEPAVEQKEAAAPKEEEAKKPDEKSEEKQGDEVPVIDDEFVKNKLTELLGDVNDENITKESIEKLQAIGITDPDMASRALEYACSARAERIITDCAECLKHFGATEDNLTPEYTKAMDDARIALNAIDAKVPGFKKEIDQAALGSNLRMVLALQKLLPFVGDEKGGINSNTGVGAQKSEQGFMDTVFAGYPSEADLK